MLPKLPKFIFFCISVFLLVSLASPQSKGDRYNGVWTVSRGGGGMSRIFLDGRSIKGVLMDTGWLQLTGERRIGQLTGTLEKKEAKITIEWSTGPKVEFRGEGGVTRRGLSLNLVQFSGSKSIKDTQFTLNSHLSGNPLKEPFGFMEKVNLDDLLGEWSGSFVYGPNRGQVYLTMNPDGTCNVIMANENPNDDTWTAAGMLTAERDAMSLTVNSGFSKQSYRGSFRSMSAEQIQISFNRDKGSFTMSLTRW